MSDRFVTIRVKVVKEIEYKLLDGYDPLQIEILDILGAESIDVAFVDEEYLEATGADNLQTEVTIIHDALDDEMIEDTDEGEEEDTPPWN